VERYKAGLQRGVGGEGANRKKEMYTRIQEKNENGCTKDKGEGKREKINTAEGRGGRNKLTSQVSQEVCRPKLIGRIPGRL